MPTPVAKGIIIGVAALVAAGIAVYESPQFRRWVNNSRRKLAVALHNLGDELDPGQTTSPFRHDISMTEEIGPAAEERRRFAREELERRRSILEERQRRANSSLGLGSFDTLVDENGHLLDDRHRNTNPLANSTAVDLRTSQPIQRNRQSGILGAESTLMDQDTPTVEPTVERDGLRLSIPAAESASRASWVTAADFTPVSEVSESMSALTMSQPSVGQQSRSSSPSSRTEGGFSEVIYAHPESIANGTALSDLEGLRFPQDRPATPPTPSTTDNYSHIAVDASSDGTLSEFGDSGAITPASWSEIGSEVSSDEYHHRGF